VSVRTTGLNHLVLRVRQPRQVADFYCRVLGFEVVGEVGDGAMVFLSATPNHHDLALMRVAPDAPGPDPNAVGMYHAAWQVETLEELSEVRDRLRAEGAQVGQSDHTVSKSLYGKDPEGNEFEVLWNVPAGEWQNDRSRVASRVLPLDLEAEIARRRPPS
jgi:catechol-2,3-dioxygenase